MSLGLPVTVIVANLTSPTGNGVVGFRIGKIKPLSCALKFSRRHVRPISSMSQTDKVAAGAVVALTVTARNSAGESPASNAVEITVP